MDQYLFLKKKKKAPRYLSSVVDEWSDISYDASGMTWKMLNYRNPYVDMGEEMWEDQAAVVKY